MKLIKILFAFGFLIVSLASCGGGKPTAGDPLAGFKPNKAELGESWSQFKHDASQNVWVFEGERPQERSTPQGARVFWNGDVTAEELSLIDSGLGEMLAACRQDTNAWQPSNLWTKFIYFQKPSDFKVMFVKSNYTLQEGEAAGCAGMVTGAHGAFTAAGTVAGMVDKYDSHMPASKGGIYILIPKQSTEQLARTECKMLMKNAVRNEGEHIWLSNDTNLYFSHANDGNPANGQGHPYCRGMH